MMSYGYICDVNKQEELDKYVFSPYDVLLKNNQFQSPASNDKVIMCLINRYYDGFCRKEYLDLYVQSRGYDYC